MERKRFVYCTYEWPQGSEQKTNIRKLCRILGPRPSICGRFQIKDVENKHKKKICSKEPIMYPNLFAFYRCKTERLPKSRDNGCLNLKNFELREATIFFLQPVTKSLFWLNTEKSIKKPSPTKVGVYQISFFDLKQACKMVPTENGNI